LEYSVEQQATIILKNSSSASFLSSNIAFLTPLSPNPSHSHNMQDFLGSLRRSLVFRPAGDDAPFSGIADKLGSAIRKSRIAFKPPPPPPPIRWRKGELIGSGAFGHVYMGMNCDSGELIAIKQVYFCFVFFFFFCYNFV